MGNELADGSGPFGVDEHGWACGFRHAGEDCRGGRGDGEKGSGKGEERGGKCEGEVGKRDEGEGKMEEERVVTNSYPMAAFMASERTRIRRALGEYELPRRAADVRAIFAADIARAEARAKAGRMTAEEFERKRKGIAAAWAHELEKPKHGLTKAEIEYWKGKL